MCKVLIIEDQTDTIDRFRGLADGTELSFIAPSDIGLTSFNPTEIESVEEQLAKFLKNQIAEHEIDLVLLDTDLSRIRTLQTHSSYKTALRELGMPVCRYQKGGSPSLFEQLPQLQRTIRDGASAIWIPRALVSGDRTNELVPRLIAISQGFKDILAALRCQPNLLEGKHSPTDVLAAVLGNPELSFEFLGYAAQNLVYFAQPEAEVVQNQISPERRYATQLGYWLFNYIIMFPGPILAEDAAAAYLNFHPDEFKKHPELADALAEAQYNGPFSRVNNYYWRFGLINILDKNNGDIQKNDAFSCLDLARIDTDNPASVAYICMISGKTITEEQAAINPDWVPAGATEAKIDEEALDELGPLAGI
ncbi:hypothetical protein ACMHYQ_12125 [Ectopseudomonas guguanensis]|uniref:hypothetical protein n=1 Tax=Ectopseudomonas guguanensis TaxID=1198456 RepID=UPI0039C2C44F